MFDKKYIAAGKCCNFGGRDAKLIIIGRGSFMMIPN